MMRSILESAVSRPLSVANRTPRSGNAAQSQQRKRPLSQKEGSGSAANFSTQSRPSPAGDAGQPAGSQPRFSHSAEDGLPATSGTIAYEPRAGASQRLSPCNAPNGCMRASLISMGRLAPKARDSTPSTSGSAKRSSIQTQAPDTRRRTPPSNTPSSAFQAKSPNSWKPTPRSK